MLNIQKVNPDTALATMKALYPLRAQGGVPMLHGSPGVGKSTIGRDLAAWLEGDFIDMRLAQMMPEDIRGLPDKDLERGVSRFLPPEDLPQSGRGVIMLDEITTCDQRSQNAALELLLDRRVGRYRVPDDYMIIAAGNNASHGALTFELSTAVADRLVHMEVVADPDQWLDWADRSGVHPTVMSFIKIRPDYLDCIDTRVAEDWVAAPSPRGWEKVSNAMKSIEDRKLLDLVIGGVLGSSVAIDFRQIMDEISSFAPAIEIMNAESKNRVDMMPKTVAGLYALVYGCRALVEDMSSCRRAMQVMLDMLDLDIQDKSVPLGEIQRLGMELVVQKGIDRGLLRDLIGTSEYKAFRAVEADLKIA